MVRHQTTRAPGFAKLDSCRICRCQPVHTSPVGGSLLSCLPGHTDATRTSSPSIIMTLARAKQPFSGSPEDATVHHLSSIMHGVASRNPAGGDGARVVSCFLIATTNLEHSSSSSQQGACPLGWLHFGDPFFGCSVCPVHGQGTPKLSRSCKPWADPARWPLSRI